MDFSVRPEAIDTFANQVTALRGDAGTAKNYIHQHLSIDYGDARMFFTAAQTCDEVKNAVLASLDQLEKICGASAGELHKTATMYRKTDKTQAGKLDETYPTR